jgi:Uma2 family endonuclease
MIQTTTKTKLTFEEYLTYNDGTDNRYEWEEGELILMNPPTFRHGFIISFLTDAFAAQIRQLCLLGELYQGLG